MRTCPLCSNPIADGENTINFITNADKAINCCLQCGNNIKNCF